MTNSAELITPKVDCDIIWKTRIREEAVFGIFRQILQLYKPDELILSFNGGKDCTVLLHMLHKFFQANTCLKHIRLPVLYIQNDDGFDEIEQFVNDCPQWYSINLIRQRGPIKEVLKEVLNAMPHLKAIFMGSRRTDPYCQKLQTMTPTDPDWPQIMRVMPLLDWTYRDIWEYIFTFNVPYSRLYNYGYTSIGNRKNTHRNPKLRIINPVTNEVDGYRPAFELIDEDGSLERAGRET